jgi:hypothetical protein
MSHRTALAPVKFGVLALALVSTAAVACSAPASSGTRVEASSAAAAHATSPASRVVSPDAATSDAHARLDAALEGIVSADRKPGTEQIRSALVGAGFPVESVEVTASRTPTGLEADAVEAAVAAGSNCIVAQLRGGNVTSAVLPVLADGRCLVGTAG